MKLISDEDETLILQAMDDLWDTVQETITVVKEPNMVVTDMSGTFVPGFGMSANPVNYTPEPESRDFYALAVEKHPDKMINMITTKEEPLQTVLLKVQSEARDYIQDGRKVLHVIFRNRKYSITSDEETAEMLSKIYYIFKLELTR